jgi:hypothetical protein
VRTTFRMRADLFPVPFNPSRFRPQPTYSWFQTFALFWMLFSFFWVLLRRLNFICRRFETHTQFHRRRLHCLWRWNRHGVPKRRHIKFRRRGITQKKEYNTANLSLLCLVFRWLILSLFMNKLWNMNFCYVKCRLCKYDVVTWSLIEIHFSGTLLHSEL